MQRKYPNFDNLLILLLIDSGCTFEEIVGIDLEDIYLDSYLPFIIIRSNKRRVIKNVNKLRTVPLLGNSLWSIQKINENKLKKKNFLRFLKKIEITSKFFKSNLERNCSL